MEESFILGSICRLCGEESSEGTSIYQDTQFQVSIITLINKYLPIKVVQTDKLPKFICQACSLQLYSTVFFLELVMSGQGKLKHILNLEKTQTSLTVDSPPLPRDPPIDVPISDCLNNQLGVPALKSTDERITPSNCHLLSGSTSDVQSQHNDAGATTQSVVTSNSLFSEFGDDFKKVFSLPLDETPLYSNSHELCKTIALDEVTPQNPPKKKRGRPKKDLTKPATEKSTAMKKLVVSQDNEETGVKRIRKLPQRYADSIQSVELEKILSSELDMKPIPETLPVMNPPDSLMLEDLVPFNIAANDSILDAITSELTEAGVQVATVSDSKTSPTSEFLLPASPAGSKSLARRKTKRRRRKRNYIQCEVCKKGFRQHMNLRMHMYTHDPVYKCAECSMYYHVHSNLTDHQNNEQHKGCEIIDQIGKDPVVTQDSHVVDSFIVEDGSQLTCRHCDKEFVDRTGLVMHIKLVLNKSRAYACHICKENFSLFSLLRVHMTSQHSSKNRKRGNGCVCNICFKEFAHPSSVLYHKETAHSIQTYPCSKCSKVFRHQQLLQRHQLVHMETRPFKCPTCQMCFKTQLSLNAHSTVHSNKVYECELCHKTLTHRSSLISHYKWHQDNRPYKCSQCPKAFNQKGNLKEHFRIHTGEKPYMCSTCNRRFTTYSQHKLHLKRHLGEKPHTCDECNKSFLSTESYKCHVRRHKGEKPFFCTFENCRQSFVDNWALKKHMKTHQEQPLENNEEQQQIENNAALLNIDLSLINMNSEQKGEETEEQRFILSTEEDMENLPRMDTVAAFTGGDGNIFYLYEDTSELIPMIDEKVTEVTKPSIENQFELVSGSSKFQYVRLPIDLTTNTAPDCPPSDSQDLNIKPEHSMELQVINEEEEIGEVVEDSGDAVNEQTLVKEQMFEAQEEREEENYVEFITEDGSLVRMLGVNALQLLSMDQDILQQGTVVE